jgi:hypothetical protein
LSVGFFPLPLSRCLSSISSGKHEFAQHRQAAASHPPAIPSLDFAAFRTSLASLNKNRYIVQQDERGHDMDMKSQRRARSAAETAAPGDGRRPLRAGSTPSSGAERAKATAQAAGLALDKKDGRIGGRVNSALVRRAKRKSGITSDSALIEAGLLSLATEDDFGRWLAAQAGRLEEDFDIGL